MRGVAGRALEDLRKEAVRISREEMVQARRRPFQILELTGADLEELSLKLDERSRVGWQAPMADDASDGAFAAYQSGLDAAAVGKHHPVGHQRVAAGKIGVIDPVSRFVKNVSGKMLRLAEVRQQ
jgi:hypothetical protein